MSFTDSGFKVKVLDFVPRDWLAFLLRDWLVLCSMFLSLAPVLGPGVFLSLALLSGARIGFFTGSSFRVRVCFFHWL